MKRDLDALMEARGLDAFVVSGPIYGNPSLIYLLNGAAVTQGIVVKKRGEPPVFIHSPLERDEAAASGLPLVNIARYRFTEILRETGDRLKATVELYRRIFADLGVRGEVGFYGMADQGQAYLLLSALAEALPEIRVRGEYDGALLDVARATKDADEVAQIREVARRTAEVVEETMAFLRRHRVKDDTLLTDDGTPLTVGQVKGYIYQLLARQGLESPEGFIFAIGRDAGVPHSRGRPDDPIRLGQTIVYDLFPKLAKGYYFDLTRTFCLGYAPPEVEKVYQDVAECLDAVVAEVRVGVEARRLQQVACAFFARRGYPTVAEHPETEVGFTHLIGHGLGLAIHEEPVFTDVPSNIRTLQPGHVFTVEPGLYDPSSGYGVRLEDVLWIDETGEVHNLTPLPKELVVEM
ncbi:MAG: Xaa-Pro peptidase family protein [Anaerolineae bacterium]|nr:Xaa-Pro peptidase family protein [Anaerolineae bacterium]MDW8067900.1 Xaa-Pro peptidase family protein [Anaerolineae bacterium]